MAGQPISMEEILRRIRKRSAEEERLKEQEKSRTLY
jgi:hypothetical protein